eukprot:4224262-Heterocapsa_arctica.AAC.1
MGLDLNTLSDADSARIIEGAIDYACMWEAVPQTDLQREPMGIGGIAAVRVKHSSACCELVSDSPCNPLSSLG